MEEMYYDERFFYCIIGDGQEAAGRDHLRELVQPFPEAAVSGNGRFIYIVHRLFSKAYVMAACAERLGMDPGRIVAVGDGYNDVPMLNGDVTKRVGCPANAVDEVKTAVTEAGGMVADEPCPDGTIAILEHYFPG